VAINTTTLNGAITAYQTTFALTSTTNVTAPTYQSNIAGSASTYTYLLVEAEMMFVTSIPVSGTVSVLRGQLGTQAVSHITLTNVTIGLPVDFPNFQPKLGAFQVLQDRFSGVSAAVASAATIIAPGPVFHVTGTTATNIITPPANFVEGEITIIADGIWTFTSSAVANGIFQSGTVGTAGTMIKFVFDANTVRWYPARIL
jgi:hypothetical protein